MRRETFKTPGALTLDLRLPSGELQIESVDGEETSVELYSPRESDGARDVIESARIELRSRGDDDEVLVDVPQRRFRLLDFGGDDLVLRVTAPHGADVQLSTASADANGRGRFGSLKAQLASGDLRFAEIGGRADVKSASGGVDIDRIGADATIATASGDVSVGFVGGDATIRSASGDVTVGAAESSVTVQTASGDQRLNEVVSGRVTMQSASGDQHVGIRRGTRVHIDAKTMSGDTSSELDVSDAPPAGEGPALELRATAMSGDIRIIRA